jgi:hypothetical protein
VSQRLTYSQIVAKREELANLEDLVDDLIPRQSFSLWVGDSGLGKSPLLMQLGLCHAYEKEFVDLKAQRGRVLVVDYENGLAGTQIMLDALAEHLGIPLPLSDDWINVIYTPDTLDVVEREIQDFKPDLVIVDGIRGLCPKAEKDGPEASTFINKCQRISQANDCAWTIIHHLRKRDKNFAKPDLFNDDLMTWFQETAGAHALINQAFVRVGVEKPETDKGHLGFRFNRKLVGDSEPFYLQRILNIDGNPIGYTRSTGFDLLTPDDRILVVKLPIGEPLKFSQVQALTDLKHRDLVSGLLARAAAAGVITASGKKRSPGRRYTRLQQIPKYLAGGIQ